MPLEDGVEPGEAVQQVVQGSLQYKHHVLTHQQQQNTTWKNSALWIRIRIRIK
jgi:hypothetical protein